MDYIPVMLIYEGQLAGIQNMDFEGLAWAIGEEDYGWSWGFHLSPIHALG